MFCIMTRRWKIALLVKGEQSLELLKLISDGESVLLLANGDSILLLDDGDSIPLLLPDNGESILALNGELIPLAFTDGESILGLNGESTLLRMSMSPSPNSVRETRARKLPPRSCSRQNCCAGTTSVLETKSQVVTS